MSQQPITDAQRREILRLKVEGKSHREITKATGVSQGTVSNVFKDATEPPIEQTVESAIAPVEVESDERNGDERTVQKVINKRIKTLAELAEVCEIDTSEWEIYKWKCTAWQTGMMPRSVGCGGVNKGKCNEKHHPWHRESTKPIYSQQYSVSAWMRLKHSVISAKNEIEELRKKAVKIIAPKFPALIFKGIRKTGNLAEYSIFDHHFGALIWGKETGWPDYDSKIAKECWEKALTTLVDRTKQYTPDRALLILGNDQQNIDNRAGTTEKGTPQNSDGRYQKMFSISRDASIWAIDALAGTVPFVDVVMVPGNHDQLATWHLGDSLRCWYRNSKNVTIDNSPLFRKYIQHGVNMLMFTHGNTGKLEEYDKTMAAERPDLWGKTMWREAHTGDRHHRRLIELKGATVRILPSLRPPCSWSSENHFVGAIRAAESYLWNDREGLIGTGVYSILDKAAA